VSPQDRQGAIERLKARLDFILAMQLTYEPNVRLANHVYKHRDEIFTFLEHPEVEATNHLAEQARRSGVLARKISGCNKSWIGAHAHEILLSVLRTAHQREVKGLAFIIEALRHPATAGRYIPPFLNDSWQPGLQAPQRPDPNYRTTRAGSYSYPVIKYQLLLTILPVQTAEFAFATPSVEEFPKLSSGGVLPLHLFEIPAPIDLQVTALTVDLSTYDPNPGSGKVGVGQLPRLIRGVPIPNLALFPQQPGLLEEIQATATRGNHTGVVSIVDFLPFLPVSPDLAVGL